MESHVKKMQAVKRRRPQRGQVLLLGVMCLIILLVAAFVVFDVSNIIRGKIKGQTAVDSAALTGAAWQMNSLNLVGELNLVKATDVLISDTLYGIGADVESFTAMQDESKYINADGTVNQAAFDADSARVRDEKAKLSAASKLLTQMQTRISFVGPLIGFGAAQQAAKNNGFDYNEETGEMTLLLYNDVCDDAMYGNPDLAPPVINDYNWRSPYAAMLYSVLDLTGAEKGAEGSSEDRNGNSYYVRGIAVGTKMAWLGEPSLSSDPPSAIMPYLTDKQIYDAIHSNYWCKLRELLEEDFSGIWWGTFETVYNGSFIGESELLPIHVDFSKSRAVHTGASNVISVLASEREQIPLDQYFDASEPYPGNVPNHNADDTDLRSDILPEMSWCIYDGRWTEYTSESIDDWSHYLRGDFKRGLEYQSGALSYFEGVQSTRTMLGSKVTTSGAVGFGGSGESGARQKRYAARVAAAESSLASGGTPSIHVDAQAKPIGRIKAEDGSYYPPFAAGRMVLPVFTHTALIPIALEPAPGMSSADIGWFYYLTEYIPILGASSTLSAAKSSAMAAYPSHWKYFEYYHKALEKLNDPAWRRSGLDWLDAPATWYFNSSGNMVITTRNRDTCDDWFSGGGGGGREGPGKLH